MASDLAALYVLDGGHGDHVLELAVEGLHLPPVTQQGEQAAAWPARYGHMDRLGQFVTERLL